VGYFVVDRIWPTYRSLVPAGKSVWLVAQAPSIAWCWLGVIAISVNIRKISSQMA
jgi:hypothetical protein